MCVRLGRNSRGEKGVLMFFVFYGRFLFQKLNNLKQYLFFFFFFFVLPSLLLFFLTI